MKANQSGFTLIELMIVVAIIGIIVAIAIPNLLDAIDRSKQRATVGDLHSWATALSAHHADTNRFPPVGAGILDTLNALVPDTVNTLPAQDHWRNDFHYNTDEINAYTIASWGKSNIDDPFGLGCSTTTWYNYDCDMTVVDGIFVESPS